MYLNEPRKKCGWLYVVSGCLQNKLWPSWDFSSSNLQAQTSNFWTTQLSPSFSSFFRIDTSSLFYHLRGSTAVVYWACMRPTSIFLNEYSTCLMTVLHVSFLITTFWQLQNSCCYRSSRVPWSYSLQSSSSSLLQPCASRVIPWILPLQALGMFGFYSLPPCVPLYSSPSQPSPCFLLTEFNKR